MYKVKKKKKKKKKKTLVVGSKEIGLEVNANETLMYIVMSRDQNAGRSHNIHNIKIDNNSFETLVEFEFLGTTLTIKILYRKKLRAD
jgi:hypothetical protein